MAQILQKLRLKENAHYFKEGIAKVLGKTPKFGIGSILRKKQIGKILPRLEKIFLTPIWLEIV